MTKVMMKGMSPWQAAAEAFGGDMEFLQFHSLAIAFRDEDGKR
jgi:hypothetical protein